MENLGPDATWLALEYLRGNLPESEMEAVEARMATDRAFFRLVRDLRAMQKVESAAKEAAVGAQVQAAAEAYFAGPGKMRPKPAWYWFAAAASVAAIVVFSIFFFRGRGQSYLDTYFSPEPKEQFLGSVDSSALARGMRKYGNKAYREAILEFQQVADTSQVYNTANYFSANAYLALRKPNAALEHLLILEKRNDRSYLDRRQWLLGLIYLDLGEREKGENALRALLDNKTSRYKKSEAREILGL